jgi:hypothetical protein
VIEQEDIAASTLARITGDNAFGRALSESPEVSSLTDITGFGLIGHISEMVGLGQLDVDLDTSGLVFYDGTESLAVAVTSADSGIFSNIKKYAQNVEYLADLPLARKFLLHDPQTNGGLLFTVSAEGFEKNRQKWQALCPDLIVIGRMTEGAIPVDLHASGVDFAIASGHKFGALPGAGFLYARNRYGLSPLIVGGGQEGGLRGGTQNDPGILSIETALQEKQHKYGTGKVAVQQSRETFERTLQAMLGEVVVIGQQAPRVPCVSFVALPGVNTKKLQWALNTQSIYITGGSACSDKTLSLSSTVTQLGYSERIAGATVRISIDEEQCQLAYERILEGIAQVLKLSSPVSAAHAVTHVL